MRHFAVGTPPPLFDALILDGQYYRVKKSKPSRSGGQIVQVCSTIATAGKDELLFPNFYEDSQDTRSL